MWNSAATSSGQKTIGNSGNGSYVDIQEDLRVKQNCTFSKTPTVNGTAVSLSNHTHSNYVQKAGDTMTGPLKISRGNSDYSYIDLYNTSNHYIRYTSGPGNNIGGIQDEAISGNYFLIQVGAGYPNNVKFQGGNISAYGNITAYSSSDKRLKQDIKPLEKSLDIINQLNPVSFKWNDKAVELDMFKNTDEIQFGLIAQETEKIIPDIVHSQYQDKEGITYKSIDYIKLIPFLIEAIQDIENQISKLETKNHIQDEKTNSMVSHSFQG